MRNVALDEQRHIGFGVKLLADLYAEDPDSDQEAIVATILREVLPWTAGRWPAADWDEPTRRASGFTLEDLGEAGAASLEQKAAHDRACRSTTCRASRCRMDLPAARAGDARPTDAARQPPGSGHAPRPRTRGGA
jgi:hypothetical protein